MPLRFCLLSALLLFFLAKGSAGAQEVSAGPLAIGSGPGEIGLVDAPNEECRGPATVTPTGDGRLAVLDPVNRKIVLVGQSAPVDVPLPRDLVEPTDLIATTRGFVVMGALGDVVLVDGMGVVLERRNGDHDPQSGTVRLALSATGELALEDIRGSRSPLGLDAASAGDPAVQGLAVAGSYSRTGGAADRVVLSTTAVSGPLSSVTLTSRMRIVDARVIWVAAGQGALVSIQESRRLPEEAAFVRLVVLDPEGRLTSEAHLDPQAFACTTRRPFARLTDGRVVNLAFSGDGLALNVVTFAPPGTEAPKPLGRRSDISLISEESEVLSALEKLNGTPSVSTISLNPIPRERILERARSALDVPWTLASANFSHKDVPNICAPPDKIWRRPTRLDGLSEQSVKGVPYKWGGYARTLDAFIAHLEGGKLAGDDCTCRKGNCVHPKAAGMDCSGFVSFAWQTGHYFTTDSLGGSNVSVSVRWGNLKPGDIVNKRRNHVRLVESIVMGPREPIITVIESTTKESCGGVCRRSYLQSDLETSGYVPLRRLSLTN